MDVSTDEVMAMMHRMYPGEVRICVLTVANEKQAALIRKQEEALRRLDPLNIHTEQEPEHA